MTSRGEIAGMGALLVGALAVSVAAPLPTYVLTLALFGIPHVLVELRYVDERFGARLPTVGPRAALAVLLAALVVVTTTQAAGVASFLCCFVNSEPRSPSLALIWMGPKFQRR